MQTDDQSDAALVGRLRSGSEDAWVELYRRHQRGVYRFALHMTGSADVAEEATQETFIAFLRQLESYHESRGTLSAYLVGIARHRVIGLLERRGSATRAGSPELASADGPMADLERRAAAAAVNRALLVLLAVVGLVRRPAEPARPGPALQRADDLEGFIAIGPGPVVESDRFAPVVRMSLPSRDPRFGSMEVDVVVGRDGVAKAVRWVGYR